ncbi:anthranilate synthase component I family protein [Nocardioides gilvus]|uniref:anthranilate synthase component I family protein n=1 Tax=Nocardioides gilvus TaxID=1735589 RepID=UPI000D741E96|nr:anthranilate synthase component I family protein [Nocardioides gilvus]
MSSPEEYFARIAAERPRCFWLDGGGAREWSGRRSIIGHLDPGDVSLTFHAATREVRRHVDGRTTVVGDDIFEVLGRELADGPNDAQWFGYFGYASRTDLPARPDPRMPDAVWMRPSVVRSFTHPATPESARTPTPGDQAPGDQAPGEQAPEESAPVPPEYAAAFAQVQEELHAGNSYEVNLTHRVATGFGLDPVTVYGRLRTLNPAPYAGFLQHDVEGARAWLLSSSPERYALVTADRTLETKPIKGTTPRGATPEADAESRALLASDSKFRAENLMIVDLLRNDLSMVCEPGSVEVPALTQVESYASVHQLVSTVRGRLRRGVSTLEALRVLFPAGSMTGAPKLRTMQITEVVEATPRGAYAGAFGWFSADGRADLGVVIRSLMTAGDGEWVLGTGGGITVRSEVGEEWAEAQWKAERLRRALLDPS